MAEAGESSGNGQTNGNSGEAKSQTLKDRAKEWLAKKFGPPPTRDEVKQQIKQQEHEAKWREAEKLKRIAQLRRQLGEEPTP